MLEPVDCPDLGVRVVPVLHLSDQNGWLPEIEHTVASYRATIADLLAEW